MAAFCDLAFPLLGLAIAAFFVLGMRRIWLGFVLGFAAVWAFCWLRVELLYYFDPQREGGVGDAYFACVFSPALAFAWSLVCLLGRLIHRFVSTKRVRRA